MVSARLMCAECTGVVDRFLVCLSSTMQDKPQCVKTGRATDRLLGVVEWPK